MKMKSHSVRTACVVALTLVVVLSLIPVLWVGNYDRMTGDDYCYGLNCHLAYVGGESVIRAALQTVVGIYEAWQGTYAASFVFALQPGVWSGRLYALSPYIVIGSLVASLGYFINRLCRCVLRAPRWLWLCAWSMAAFLCVQFPRNATQGFYSYNGGTYYALFTALMLVQLGFIVDGLYRPSPRGRVWRTLLMSFLSVLIAGGNFSTALLGGVLLAACVVWSRFKNRCMTLPIIVALIVYLAGFAVSILAPGNAARAAFMQGLGPIEAIIGAVLGVPRRMGGMFFRHPGIVLTLLLIWTPLCLYAQREPAFSYKWPWLPPILSWLVLGVMFTPPFYAAGSGGPDRLWNIVYYVFALLLMANIFYWAGWLRCRFKRLGQRIDAGMRRGRRLAAPYIAVCLIGILCVSGLGPDLLLERGTPTAVQAIKVLWDGSARQYAREHDEVTERMQDPGTTRIVIEPFSVHPALLPNYDFAREDVSWWRLEDWYGLDYVGTQPAQD